MGIHTRHPLSSRATLRTTALLGAAAGAALALGTAPGVRCDADQACPTVAELRGATPLPEGLHLFDHLDRPYADVGGARRVGMPLERIPSVLVEGFPAVEDRRFYEHGGVDVYAAGRAALRNLDRRGLAEGASTIPMQLVRTLWAPALSEKGVWARKLVEVRSAIGLVRALGHDRVLELYLNGIYLGDGVYGVGAASRHYFGVPPDSLSLAEAATLIGITRTPERYDPREHPERAKARRDVVLDVLVRSGVVTAEEASRAREAPVETVAQPPATYRRDYVTAAVRRELRRVAPELVGRPGLRIFTTIDAEVQAAGEAAVAAQLEAIESGRYGRFGGPAWKDVEGPPGALQASGIALDPSTGAVRGLVGGRSFAYSELDRALQTRRQVGSLAKPFVLATALEAGRTLADPISTDTLSVRTAQGIWSPGDHVDEDTLTLRDVVVHSSNRAAVRVGMEVGIDRVVTLARTLGVEGDIPPYPSSLLGAFEASLGSMTAAYASFANGGHRIEPWLIRRVEAPDGTVLWRHEGPIGRIPGLDPAVAFLVLDGLRGVVDGGTGWRVREHYRGPAAGKTGTTDEGRDAWFVGLTPSLAAGIWVGFDRPGTIVRGADAGRLAAPAWGRWMAATPEAASRLDWTPPIGVARAVVDGISGRILPETCPAEGGRVRRTWVRTATHPIPTGGVCALPPPNPHIVDVARSERMRSLFRIPRSVLRDTLSSH